MVGMVVVVAALAALTACNASDGEGDDSPTTTVPVTSTVVETTVAPVPADSTVAP
jgi:predicted small secreted protein